MKISSIHTFENYIYKIFFFFVFFPYISIINLPSDTQPYAVLLGFIIVLVQKEFYASKSIFFSFLLIPAALLVLISSNINITGLRSFIGYFSFFIIGLSSHHANKKYRLSSKGFLIIVFLWFILALLQITISRDIGSFLISDMRTTSERGITSFAPEPSYFGIILVFFYIYNKIFYNIKYLNLIIGIQIIFFSQSFMIISLFLLYIFLIVFFRSKIKIKVLLIVVPIILFFILSFIEKNQIFENEYRVFKLIKLLMKGPKLLFKMDASANDRLAHIVYSFKGTIQNLFLPNGYNRWSIFIRDEVAKQKYFWWVSSGRIMSTYGGCFFELGFIGIIVPFTINIIIIKAKKKLDKNFFSLIIFINLLLLTAIPLAFPPLAFLMGFITSIDKNKRKINEKNIIYCTVATTSNRAGQCK